METENEIDQLFKRGLNDPQIPFNEMDWEKMARKLDETKKKRIVPIWVFTASGVAAALLIFLFWFLLNPSVSETGVNNPVTIKRIAPGLKKHKQATGADAVTINPKGLSAESTASNATGTPAAVSSPGYHGQWTGNNNGDAWAGYNVISRDAFASAPIVKDNIKISQIAPLNTAAAPFKLANPIAVKTPERPAAAVSDSAIIAQKAMALALSKDPLEKLNHTAIAKSVQKKMDEAFSQRPNLILTAMAAPDISSGPSGSNRSSKVSKNFGVLATYALGSKFSLTSGAIYAKKYYNYGSNPAGDNIYSSPAGTDWEVKADCNVIDVPVNVNYKLLDKRKFSVSVNTGLSSYFMLKEKYDYIIDRPDQPQQVSTTVINNQNQHVFGIANVSLSLDHQISKTISIGVQPFAKLPLTGIGNYDVDLKSTGVSFSINIGLFPSKKPGKLAANRYSSLY
ncbi:MAG: hypothetical protein ABWY16_17485 [Pedobacter sp.]|uniref:hypothetical protein n=1 Tax=Pedobacter sp. TaxID=1411316 RepID=UPI003392983B